MPEEKKPLHLHASDNNTDDTNHCDNKIGNFFFFFFFFFCLLLLFFFIAFEVERLFILPEHLSSASY